MRNTTLSIIVPVFNVEKYLSSCIESIIKQSFTDWELILVNDGSIDRSSLICDEYAQKDDRITAFHLDNSGAASARNYGISNSQGTFITFIDSDDTINPSFLDNFSYNESLDFEIQGLSMNYIDNAEKNYEIKPQKTQISSTKQIYEESELNRLARGPVCKLFKRSIINQYNILFPKGIQFGEDAIFVKEYLSHCNGRGLYIAAADYIYNHYPNQNSLTSKRHPGEMMYKVAKMDLELFERLEQQWGAISSECRNDFFHIRALEFYYSICLYFTERKHGKQEQNTFIQQAKRDFFPKIKQEHNIPITYSAIRLLLTLFSSNMSCHLIKCMFFFIKPNL